jgi:uncharacterized membrane protein
MTRGSAALQERVAMFDRGFLILQLPATIGAGLVAGTFFCFSNFVLPALTRLEQLQGISAMQKINTTVINPLFMTVLFGTAVLHLVQAVTAYRSGLDAKSAFWLLAAFFYVVGAIGTTIAFNVPLNDALAKLTPTVGDMAFWSGYVKAWTMWNSLRGVAATLACAAGILAMAL